MTSRETLVARYCAERTIEHRNAVVEAHRYLCVRGARKFKRDGNDRADLEQVAAIGLLKAAQNYRAELRTPFTTYAWIMVVGELMHEVRDHERLVRLPRRLRTLERRHHAAVEAFVVEHGREPSDPEIAAALGVDVAAIHEVRIARGADRVERWPLASGDVPSFELPAIPATPIADTVALRVALDRLAQRERAIVLGTYAVGLTQSELGAELGLSQSHVSKLLARALGKLRPALA